MKKWLKITLWLMAGFVLLISAGIGFMVYKVKYGIATYETEQPAINIPTDKPAILLYSKTTGFRHGQAIEASKKALTQMAKENGWFLYETEESGIINAEQLAQFEVVIWNNSTGRTLTDEQRIVLENYVENGGGLLGIHGSGDDSHHWDWYEENFIGARFSHHPIKNQLQETTVEMEPGADSLLTRELPQSWEHTGEWYVFFSSPREKGYSILHCINGESIDPNGNLLFISDKDFGMGDDHPVAWYHTLGSGRTFYTSMGHTAETFEKEVVLQLLKNAIYWAGQLEEESGL